MQPFFLNAGARRLLCVHHAPARGSGAGVLLLPPFAEEMNQARRFHALLARGLAARGLHALSVDLSGTGDSSGELRAASWDDWREDLATAHQWLAAHAGTVHLFALRSAALLLPLLAARATGVRWCLLEPALDGERTLGEFLRIRVARSLFEGGRETVDGLRRRLAEGQVIEVSGYELTPALHEALGTVRVDAALLGSAARLRVVLGRRAAEDWRARDLAGGATEEALVAFEQDQLWTNDGPEPAAPLADAVSRSFLE